MDAVIMSIIAGIFGTGLGGLATAAFGVRSDRMNSVFLSFSGGVMTGVVFFELIPDAAEHANAAVVLLGLAIGVAVALILEYIIDAANAKPAATASGAERKTDIMRSGVLILFVIGLHNIPAGLVIGAAESHEGALGLILTLMIGVHNIPEGMAIAAPLISGGLERRKAVMMTLMAGVPTVFGAAIGILAGSVSYLTIALSFSVAAGAMLYAVFGEIIPQSIRMDKSRVPALTLLAGIAAGYLLTLL